MAKKNKRYRKNPNRSLLIKYNNKYKNHFNYKLIIVISIILLISLSSIILVSYPFIKIMGDNIIELNYNEEYIEYGYKGNQFFKDISSKIKIKNNIDINKVGEYKVEYYYKYLGFKISKIRVVKVVDKVSPVITLEGDTEINICPNIEYVELGYKAIDEYDKDLTDKVKVSNKDNIITYSVEDNSGNVSEVTRKINKVDSEKPTIELSGKSTVYLTKYSYYNEAGYKAYDNCDGDITDKVVVSNNIDTNVSGSYTVLYTVSDSGGNSVSVTRNVVVYQYTPSSNSGDRAGVIYLTFDDGPSYSITPNILDILASEGVSATFFVIGTSGSFNEMVNREYSEGHTVALHSNSHSYSYIYSSTSAYFDDLNTIRNKVYNITGEYSNILRFPGGGSNTVSSNYSSGIMTALTNEVRARGYHYFDWNVDSGDAEGYKTSQTVYNRVVNSLSPYRSNVVLMHDFEGNTATLNALRDIIQYAKANGYTFERITMDTSEVHHAVAN